MTSQELIPRATVEEIVRYRDNAIELYKDAFSFIEEAAAAIKAANDMANLASGGVTVYVNSRENGCNEIDDFEKAVKLPQRDLYEGVARRLTDLRVWSWVVQRTDLERLMDAEAKETLRQQMRYIPAPTKWNEKTSRREVITGEEVERGMPPVTVDNIYATIQQFAQDADSIFRRGVANAFSKLDRRFRSHDGFKVGSRIILTYAFSSFSGGLNYGRQRDELLDIERAFAVLDNGSHLGAQYGQGVWALDRDRSRGAGYGPKQSVTDTKYFKIRGFKNGNAHLWFTRDDLVDKVNKLLAEWYGEVIGDERTKAKDPFAPKTTPAKRFGFFPTPPAAVKFVIEQVPLYRDRETPAYRILEPSAGTGNLARPCATAGYRRGQHSSSADSYDYAHKVDCIEVQPELARALQAEGVYNNVMCSDFLQVRPRPDYDLVVMNPPFDLERDIDHVMHAWKFLKPTGTLVAIMSAGTEFRETRKAKAFREMFKLGRGTWRDLPANSFSEVGTNVNTCLLKARKDGKERYW